MNLYLISQDENTDYDTYDSAVVAAPDEETARHMDPATGEAVQRWEYQFNGWCSSPIAVKVELIGKAAPHIRQGIVCASFNAG